MISSPSRIDQSLCWFLLVLVYLAPLPFGAVEPWSTGVLEVLILLLFSVLLVRRLAVQEPLEFPLARTALFFLALHLLQLIPVPGVVLRWVSPMSHYLFQALRPADAGDLAQTISVSPEATMASLLWTSCCVAVFYLALNIAGHQQGRRVAVRLLPRAVKRLFNFSPATRAEELALLLGLTLAAAGVFQACYGLLERALGWSRIFFYTRRYPMDGVAGTFINTNHCAAFLALCLPLLISLILLLAEGDRRTAARRSPGSLVLKILLTAAALAVALALLLTRSGGGVVSSLAGTSFLLFGYLRGVSRVSWKRVLAGMLVLLIVTFTALLIFAQPSHTMTSFFSTVSGDLSNRLGIYRQSLTICRDFPLLGSGAGTYHPMMVYYFERVVVHAHNEYLELLCDLGPAGLFCALVLLLHVLGMARSALFPRPRDRRPTGSRYPVRLILPLGFSSSLLTLALHCVVDFPLRIPAIALSFSCMLGVLVQLFLQLSGDERSSGKAGSHGTTAN